MTFCLACILTHAQQIDTTLLFGRWELYSMQSDGFSMCRDSIAGNIQRGLLLRKAVNPTETLTPADSIALVDSLKTIYRLGMDTYLTFDAKGNTTVAVGLDKTKEERSFVETGTYMWSGDGKLIQNLGRSKPDVFIIIELTSKRLTMKPEVLHKYDDILMTFTRAK
jgi:hypothetical protein